MPEQYKKGNTILAQISGGTFTDICAVKNRQLILPNNNQKSGGVTDMDIMFFANNKRKMHGLPLWRKKNRRKRCFTRCEADETISAFLEYCNRK